MREYLREALNRPVDIAWLAAFRILFGLVMSVSMFRFIAYGWIDRFFVKPTFHFKYWGFAWVPAPSHTTAHVLFWVMAGLAACICVGAWFRVAAPLFVLGFAYIQLIDATTYLNHYYLALVLSALLAVSPAHRAWSVDAWRRRSSSTHIPAGWLWLLRAQVGIVYTYAGLAKAQSDWLLEGQPLRIWLSSLTSLPLLGPLFAWDPTALLMSWAGFLFDASIVIWMSWRRTRPFAYAIIIVFHILTRVLFPIGMFPVIMVLSALVFFSPSWPRDLWARLRRQSSPSPVANVATAPAWRSPTVTLASLFVLFQLLMPLRHWLYGGNVLWDEQGMRFSWRVMVREKNGSVNYVVKQTSTGRQWEVSPRRYLNRIQENEMAGQPDLILQLAHHIQRDFAARGIEGLEVRASAFASLNGRPAAYLVDPNVDLAKTHDGLAKADWIAPDPHLPLPRLRAISAR